jgi:hypothetical protein
MNLENSHGTSHIVAHSIALTSLYIVAPQASRRPQSRVFARLRGSAAMLLRVVARGSPLLSITHHDMELKRCRGAVDGLSQALSSCIMSQDVSQLAAGVRAGRCRRGVGGLPRHQGVRHPTVATVYTHRNRWWEAMEKAGAAAARVGGGKEAAAAPAEEVVLARRRRMVAR